MRRLARPGTPSGRFAAPRTEAARTTIRINRDGLLRELGAEAHSWHEALIAARDASDISEFSNALRAGALSVCCNCAHFTFAADPAAPGQCALLREEVWPFVPFTCRTFAPAAEPVT